MPKYDVLVAESAEKNLDEIFNYFAFEIYEKGVAQNISGQLDEAILSLEEMPQRCPLIDENLIGKTGMRKLIIRNYIVLFVINEKTKEVFIARVLHAKRDWLNLI